MASSHLLSFPEEQTSLMVFLPHTECEYWPLITQSPPLSDTDDDELAIVYRPVQSSQSTAVRRFLTVQLSSVAQSCLTLCDPTDRSTPGLRVHHQLPELTQTHVHWVSDAFQPSHPLSSPSPPTFNLSQHQGIFKWVSSSHQVAKVLEFQLQHQSFQWIFRTGLL